MSIRLIVDSASDINMAEANELGITMVPMQIRFGDEEFFDGVDLLPSVFYDKLACSEYLPQTSQINPYRFEELFNKELEQYDEIILITMSSKLSGTYNSAVEAANKFDGKVFVVDSLNACIGERLLCLFALNLIKEGSFAAEEIVNELNEKKSKINVIAMIDTLNYLKKGGRISPAAAMVGTMFNIKPIISVVNGEIKVVGKAVGSKKGVNLLNSLIEKTSGIDFDMPYGIVWSGNDDALPNKYIQDSITLWEGREDIIPSYVIGSTIGTHIGPGAIGVSYFSR